MCDHVIRGRSSFGQRAKDPTYRGKRCENSHFFVNCPDFAGERLFISWTGQLLLGKMRMIKEYKKF